MRINVEKLMLLLQTFLTLGWLKPKKKPKSDTNAQ